MERNREARRGSVAPMNGGISRRRQRSSSLRDSPEEDGAMEMQESGRLRERGAKKDRDRERGSRSKRRRGDRVHGNIREEGEDSSEESLDDYVDDEEEDTPLPVRLPPPAASPAPSSSLPTSNHLRKSFPAKVVRAPAVWKADEMIGVPIPRKARSGTGKRSQDCWSSGSGAAPAGGEPIHRQPSTSPARPSPVSTVPMSPSSSNASIKKKIKPIGGNKPQRPQKIVKSSSIQEIEIEVAEVLYGMTRQFPPKQDGHKHDSKETNGSSTEAKSRVSSPISQTTTQSQPPSVPAPNSSSSQAPMHVIAPKRKRPRPVKFDDESPTSPTNSAAVSGTQVPPSLKTDPEPPVKTEALSPKSEKPMPAPVVENGGGPMDLGAPQASAPADVQYEPSKPESKLIPDSKPCSGESQGRDRPEAKNEAGCPAKESPISDKEVNPDDGQKKKADQTAESQKEEKFSIDLMAPPPGKLSPDRDGFPDSAADIKSSDSEIKLKIEISRRGDARGEGKPEAGEILHNDRNEKYSVHEFDVKKQVGRERNLDLHLDLEKHDKENLSTSKQQIPKQQPKAPPRSETKPDKAGPSGSVPVPMPMGGWPSKVPPFGYMGQFPSLPAVIPMDGNAASSKTMQPPNFLSPQPRPKRCATHCYIAQNIYYHQQIAKMNPFWPAAAGAMPLYGAKPYNLNVVPPSDSSSSILGNPLQGSLAGRAPGSLPEKGTHASKEKISGAANSQADSAQRKQLVLQQVPAPGSANNMLHGPAFIFSLNQQAAGAAAAANRSVAPKSAPVIGNAGSSSTSGNAGGASTGGPPATVNFNYAVPGNEAQYLAILQNNPYTFPIPAAVGAPPAYRGGIPTQAMPFFNGSFYSSQMLHPSQLQQQQQQPPLQPSHTQQGNQNPSTSSGSSSSQKHPQQSQQLVPGAAVPGPAPPGLSSQNFPGSKQRQQLLPHPSTQLDSETGCEDTPSTADSRVSQSAQKTVYGQNFAMPIHPQNFALISPAAAVLSGGAGHSEKQTPSQPPTMKVELTPSQAFAMSFASLSGAAAAGAPAGLDFSSMAQNHAIFQSLPEAARQGYQITAATAAATQEVQHLKKSQQALEDGKSGRDVANSSVAGEDERKMMVAGKAAMNAQHQSLNFSRPDSNPPMPSILGNTVVDSSSRTLNLIPSNVNGGGMPNRPSSSVPTTSTSGTATIAATVNTQASQHQQQLIQLQKQQQQQQLQLQQQLACRTKPSAPSNSASLYLDRLPAGSTVTKFPQALTGFPQTLIQTGSPSQSPQWKSSARTAAPSSSSSNNVASTGKNNLPQQQTRISQQSIPPQVHQTQISFGMNSLKMAAPAGQQLAGGNNMPALSSASASMVIGSPPNSAASKSSAGGGSPRASTNSKPGPLPATSLPLVQQASAKSSPSSSTRKSSPVSNRNVPSILGQPQIGAAQSSSASKQQQQQHQHQHRQAFPQAQLFFSNAYTPPHSSQAGASPAAVAAAAYYQRRQSEQQAQQQSSTTSSTGMLSLSPSTLSLVGAPVTADPAKAAAAAGVAAANSVKGMPPGGLLPQPFPYVHAMPSVSVKPAEQKPAAGNDNMNASWQPEKR